MFLFCLKDYDAFYLIYCNIIHCIQCYVFSMSKPFLSIIHCMSLSLTLSTWLVSLPLCSSNKTALLILHLLFSDIKLQTQCPLYDFFSRAACLPFYLHKGFEWSFSKYGQIQHDIKRGHNSLVKIPCGLNGKIVSHSPTLL